MADAQLGETLKSALDISLRYYGGLLQLSTGYLQSLGALLARQEHGPAAAGPAAGAAPAAAASAARPAPPFPPLLLAAIAGREATASFAVENTLSRPVTARLEVRGAGPAARLVPHPELVALDPGEQCVVQARVTIDADMPLGQDLLGELAVPELASRTIPFVIRRLPEADAAAPAAGSSAR